MKVERIQPKATIKIELDEDTAEKLCALIDGVTNLYKNKDTELDSLFEELDAALPGRERSFSDFFIGSVTLK